MTDYERFINKPFEPGWRNVDPTHVKYTLVGDNNVGIRQQRWSVEPYSVRGDAVFGRRGSRADRIRSGRMYVALPPATLLYFSPTFPHICVNPRLRRTSRPQVRLPLDTRGL